MHSASQEMHSEDQYWWPSLPEDRSTPLSGPLQVSVELVHTSRGPFSSLLQNERALPYLLGEV